MTTIYFSDFDGTLTLDKSQLTTDFFKIIQTVEEKNRELVIVSGRSVSWGHFFLTHFPLKACIMEGGGVILTLDDNGLIIEEPLVSKRELEELVHLTAKLQAKFPQIPLSKDSFGRLSDRAIEFHLMETKSIQEVVAFMDQNHLNYSKSNVHINFWVGEISKYLGVKHFLKKYRPDSLEENCWFFGDAPNDESMFQFFKQTVGVSNIKEYLDQLKFKPKIILTGDENVGPKGVLNFIKET